MLSFINSLIKVTPTYQDEGYDTYVARDSIGTYWYVIDTDDFTGPEPSIVIDPCHFGPAPA